MLIRRLIPTTLLAALALTAVPAAASAADAADDIDDAPWYFAVGNDLTYDTD